MKEAYKCSLGLMLVLTLIGGLACCDGGGGDNSTSNPVTTVVGSGNIVQETRSVTGATGVHLSGVANLTIEQGAPEELILERDDNLMAHIFTEVQGGILVISKDPTVSLQPSRSQGTGIEAHLTLSSIDSITHSGVGGIMVPDLKTTQLELTKSGLGGIEIINLDAQTLDVLISGLGDISVAGQVVDQIITLDLGTLGDYKAENLSSTTVDVEIAGSRSATVRVSTTLNAEITGSGSVFYHGSPVVTRTGNGSGSVVPLPP
jgi:hypothetical protein